MIGQDNYTVTNMLYAGICVVLYRALCQQDSLPVATLEGFGVPLSCLFGSLFDKPANILLHLHPCMGALKLSDFGAAARLTATPIAPASAGLIKGLLACMAPAQIRRMCHIARIPQSPCQIVPAVPEPLAAMVLKLQAKQAEQRCQSAQFNLERCGDQWEPLRRTNAFPLGEVEARLLVPTVLQQEHAERQRAEAALRQAEANYRSIFENAAEGIFQTTPAGRIIAANPAWARMLGYESPAELIAAISDVQTQLYVDPAQHTGLLRLLDEQEAVKRFEAEFYRKDGSRIWTSFSIRNVRDEHGQVRYYECMAEDITERKQAEAALCHWEERYRDLYDNAPDGYCVIDTEGLIREINATQLGWLGYRRHEVIGRLLLEDMLIPEDGHQIAHLLERCRREGRLEHVEQTLKASGGRRLPVRLSMRAIRSAAGHCTGYSVTIRDIAKEKELEAQLLQAQKLEILGTLVGGIAHDFNNMLTSILGFTDLLLLEVTEKSIQDDLRHIEMLGHRAADMVRRLLTFSRQSHSQKHSLVLRPFLEDMIRLLKRTIPETIAVELRLAAEKLVVQADATQLQQVVMNLAVNARDAMPNGGRLTIESARVMLDAAFCQAHPNLSPGWYAQLSVSDTGVGIPPAIRSRIFDPFFTTKGVGQGTGLGLSVVHKIVQSHAGAIEVESEMGQGTSMTIYLPLSQQPLVEAEAPLDELLRGNATLLLVEDEPLVLEYGRKALERLGYRVLTAHDGLAAIEVFEAHQEEIALVILDVVMPRMGGLAAAQELKRRKATVAVLLTTGYDCAEAASEEWKGVEEYEFLRKPYRICELARAVRAMLERNRSVRRLPADPPSGLRP